MRILVTGGAGFLGSHLSEKELGREPSVQLREGLERTVEYFRELTG